jgi:hypothetical protein
LCIQIAQRLTIALARREYVSRPVLTRRDGIAYACNADKQAGLPIVGLAPTCNKPRILNGFFVFVF